MRKTITALSMIFASAFVYAQNVSTFAGTPSTTGDGTTSLLSAAKFDGPINFYLDGTKMWVVEYSGNRVRLIDNYTSPSTAMAYTRAGSVTGLAGNSEGTGNGVIRFNGPVAIVKNSAGYLFIADEDNYVIRTLSPFNTIGNPQTSALYAGNYAFTDGYADGKSKSAKFGLITDLEIDTAGNLYVADATNHCIRMITSDTVVSTVAGDTIVGNTDGIGSAARFSYPYGLTWLNNRELLIVDMVGKKIRKLNILTKAVTTVSSITYNNPQDIAIDALGNMYVSGLSGYIVKIENGAVKDFAGLSGSTGTTDGNGTAARFMRPVGMVYINNTLYVADLEGHTIRKITTPTTSVDELALSTTMNMYPNPASNKVTLLNVHEGQKVALYNVQGVQIAEFISEGTKIELDLSAYAKGVYLLKSVHNGSVSNAKLLVE